VEEAGDAYHKHVGNSLIIIIIIIIIIGWYRTICHITQAMGIALFGQVVTLTLDKKNHKTKCADNSLLLRQHHLNIKRVYIQLVLKLYHLYIYQYK